MRHILISYFHNSWFWWYVEWMSWVKHVNDRISPFFTPFWLHNGVSSQPTSYSSKWSKEWKKMIIKKQKEWFSSFPTYSFVDCIMQGWKIIRMSVWYKWEKANWTEKMRKRQEKYFCTLWWHSFVVYKTHHE